VIILEQVLAKFWHGHAFGLSAFNQARQGAFIKLNFQPVLVLEFVRELQGARS